MKLLGKRQLTAHVRPLSVDPQTTRLRIGTLDRSLDRQEAIGLAAALVKAVDDSTALLSAAEGTQ
jgi:hypothetical protein